MPDVRCGWIGRGEVEKGLPCGILADAISNGADVTPRPAIGHGRRAVKRTKVYPVLVHLWPAAAASALALAGSRRDAKCQRALDGGPVAWL
eukprot:scaffold315172_cov31-Tisochrysis_lutea.AAC.1